MSRQISIAFLLALVVCGGAAAQQANVTIEPLPDSVWRNMQGKSWHSGLPCPSRQELVLLKVPYWNYQGRQETGLLIVARSAAGDVASAMQEIFDSRAFRFAKMRLIDDYGGSDDASIADNNTSAFNCRKVEGSANMSKHARGLAIDINPVENPYVDAKGVFPAAGARHSNPAARTPGVTGLIVKGDVVTRAFQRIGWSWGGAFRTIKDYQHFAK